MVFQWWFHVCAEENSCAGTVGVYIDRVATETPAVLQFLINMVDDNGNTALHYSASHSNFSIVKLLLDTGQLLNLYTTTSPHYSTMIFFTRLSLAHPAFPNENGTPLFHRTILKSLTLTFIKTLLLIIVPFPTQRLSLLLPRCESPKTSLVLNHSAAARSMLIC